MTTSQKFRFYVLIIFSGFVFGGGTPSFFVPNRVSTKTGKTCLNMPDVDAMYQTQKGRVLFNGSGAYFNVSGEKKPSVLNADKRNRPHADLITAQRFVVMKLGFPGQSNHPVCEDVSPGKLNILKGSKDQWQNNMALYNRLTYKNAWPGIDLSFNKDQGLSFSVLLSPEADASKIILTTEADFLDIDNLGRLHIELDSAGMELGKPYAFQEINGTRVEVGVSYRILENGTFTFALDTYDTTLPLTIDPFINWSTYLGGDGREHSSCTQGTSVAIDSSGNFYLTGLSDDSLFPTTPGAYAPTTINHEESYIILKLNSSGALVYATFLGGGMYPRIHKILVDGSGQAIVCGRTSQTDFPTTPNAHDTTFAVNPNAPEESTDGFITKMNATGTALVCSTLFGGLGEDTIRDMAIAPNGDIVFTGMSYSTDLPHNGTEYDRTNAGNGDAFVARISGNLQTLDFVTFLGGTTSDSGEGICIDSDNNIYVTGYTGGGGFPVSSGTYSTTYSGGDSDGFVAKLSGTGISLGFATYIGGSSDDVYDDSSLRHGFIALSSTNHIIVSGITKSPNFPLTGGSFGSSTSDGYLNTFVLSLDNSGTSLDFSGRLGGTSSATGFTITSGLALDSSNDIYIAGYTEDNTYPTTASAYDTSYNGSGGWANAFVAKIQSNGSSVVYSSYLGGEEEDKCFGMTITSSGEICVTGHTKSSQFPTTSGAIDRVMNCESELFFSKFDTTASNLLISTFLGGSMDDEGEAMAMDTSENVYVTGQTKSSTFPLTAGAVGMGYSGDYDLFVTKLSSADSSIIYSTIFGGIEDERAYDLCISPSDEAYVVGSTASQDFPLVGSYSARGQSTDVFISRLNSSGTALLMSTVWGGSSWESAQAVALTPGGDLLVVGSTGSSSLPLVTNSYGGSFSDCFYMTVNATSGQVSNPYYLGGDQREDAVALAVGVSGTKSTYIIAGFTYSDNFPTSSNAIDKTNNGSGDAFITEIVTGSGGAILYSTFLGGSDFDRILAIKCDSSGVPIIAGETESTDFPVTAGVYDTTYNGNTDGFVAKIPLDGTALVYATYLGGSQYDTINDITLDSYNDPYVVGSTASTDFPDTSPDTNPPLSGDEHAFLARFSNNAEDLTYTSFIGGTKNESAFGVDLVNFTTNNIAVAGNTNSSDFPTTTGASSESLTGEKDIYVVYFNFCPPEFIKQPQSTGACLGDSASFSVETRGGGTVTYQWVFEGSSIAGANSSTYTIPVVAESNAGSYICWIFSSCAAAISLEATLTINDPVIVTQPVDTVACIGSNTQIQVSVTGLNVAYQWEFNGTPITGATSATLNITGVQNSHAGNYKCLYSNACSGDYSDTVSLTVTDLSISAHPTDQTVCSGEPMVIFQVTAQGTGLSYQWQKNNQNLSSETEAHLELPNVQASDDGAYRCLVTNACGTINSNTANLNVNTADITISAEPQSVEACLGDPASLCITATGGAPLSYQWYLNGSLLAGETSACLDIASLVAGDYGDYWVDITNPCGGSFGSQIASIQSPVNLVASISPRVQAQGLSNLFLHGDHNMCSDAGITYQWENLMTSDTYSTQDIVVPVQTVTADFLLTVTDTGSGAWTQELGTVLVAPDMNLDFNGDSCNSLEDLFLAFQYWRTGNMGDFNMDGLFDIRDYLYINTDDPIGCGAP